MKTNMPIPINFSNYGFVQGKLSDDLYNSLMNEITTAKDNNVVMKKLEINMNLRPQNLDFETYYKLADELGNLRG